MKKNAKPDLWGDLPIPGAERMPADLLREQAEALAAKTNNVLDGEVDSQRPVSSSKNVCFRFVVRAPMLEYRTSIFEVEYDAANSYPCEVRRTLAGDDDARRGGGFKIKPQRATTELELADMIKEILQSPEVRKLIAGLWGASLVTEEPKPRAGAFGAF